MMNKNVFGSNFLSNILNPPEIEKILDTTLTKDNQRYYKVKWVKITWESEADLSYFNDIIASFWSEYTRECLLDNIETNENNCQFSSNTNKDVYNFVTVPPNDIVRSNITEAENPVNIFSQTDNDTLLQIPNHSGNILSMQSPMDINIVDPVNNSIECVTETPYKSLNHLAESHNLSNFCNEKTQDGQKETMPVLDDGDGAYDIESPSDAAQDDDNDNEEEEVLDSTSTSNMKDHIIISTALSLSCSHCSATFNSKESYTTHKHTHNERKCTVCGKQFQRLGHLQTHMNTHTNSRPFSCDQCSKSFSDKSALSKHKLVHSSARRHACVQCNMSFKRAEHLRRHQDCHKKVKKFTCEVCRKQFSQKSALKTHLNIHSGTKPHNCSICNKAFTDASTLRNHMFSHNKPFNCEECQRTFSRSSTLKSHMKSKHNSKLKEDTS